MIWRAMILGCLPAGALMAQQMAVPSGQPIEFVELVKDAEGTAAETWRFRFLAPQIARDGGSVSVDAALDDMQAVCDAFVAPALASSGAAPGQVIISLADRPVPFGEPAPEATQFFEAFRLQEGRCVWEGF